jgi:hypothetical protein
MKVHVVLEINQLGWLFYSHVETDQLHLVVGKMSPIALFLGVKRFSVASITVA